MTKKDYRLIAEVLKQIRPIVNGPAEWRLGIEWSYTVEKFADALAKDNPRFDREKFLAACGMEN